MEPFAIPEPLRNACRTRREKLAAGLDHPWIVPAGRAQPRNYRANTFPFRASSHFLYLVGAPLEEAVLLESGDGATLFAKRPTEDDALWHGATPSLSELGDMLGLSVLPLEALEAQVKQLDAAVLLPPDALSVHELSAWLGRDAQTPTSGDLALQEAMIALRLVHDSASMSELRRGARVTARAHTAGMKATAPGMLEARVRAAMEYEIRAENMDVAYQPIVTIAGEVLHNNTYHRELKDGDLLLADVGAETPLGWASDVTRTWPVNGAFSSTQRIIYEAVLEAQRAGIEKAGPFVPYVDVHRAAALTLTEALVGIGILRGDPLELVADGVHALFFPHGIGHLLGLDVHDMEDLGDLAGYDKGTARSTQFGLSNLRLQRTLKPGMAVTIEPGFYQVPALLASDRMQEAMGDRVDAKELARFADVRGIRIEDDILITEGGREILTSAVPKLPADVEAAVGMAAHVPS